MAILGSATYKLDTDNSRLNRGMAKAEQTSRERSKRIAGNFAKIGAAGVAMGAGIGLGLINVGKQASNLNESINAVNVVFGQGAKTILDFSKNASTAVGLAASDFNQLSATTGALFTNFGLSEKKAAEETINLTKRAADLASVFNTDVDDALGALQAAIRGETEPLRRFAGDVTDASLELYLMNKGITRSVSEMTQAEKGLLRYEVAMSQTDKVENDFQNTITSAANALRVLNAQIKDTKAMLGQGLLPVFEEVLPWVQSVVASFREWAEQHPKLMRALVIGAAAVTVLTLAIGGALLALAAIIMIAPFAAVAWGIALGPVGWIALAVIALIGLIVLLWVKWDWLMEKFGELSTWQKVAVVIGLITVPILNIILAGIWLIKNWDKVKAKALAIWDGLKAAWGWVSTFVSNWYVEILAILFPVVGLPLLVRKHWGTIWDVLGPAWDTAWGWIKGVLTSAWDGIKTAWDASWGWVEDKANIWDGVKAAWEFAWGGIKWVPVNAWAWIKTIWDWVWGGIKWAVEHAWDGIKAAWNFVWGGIKWVPVNAWAWIKTIWDWVWGGIKWAVEHAWDGIKAAWNFVWGGIKWVAVHAWAWIKTIWDFVWGGIKWAVEHAWDGISAAWSLAWGGIKWAATTAWDGIKAAWNFVWPGIKWAVAHAWDGISAAWKTAWGGIKGVLASAWGGIKVAWNTIFPPLRTAALAIWNGVSAAWETAWGGIKGVLASAWGGIGVAWNTIFPPLRAAALAIWDGISAVWETAWGGIKTAATNAWDALVVAWDTVIGGLRAAALAIWDGISAVWETAWGGIKTAATNAWDALVVAWDTVSGPLKTGIKTIWNGISAVWATAWGGMKSTVKGALNIIIGWINSLIGAWNGIAFRVPTITLPSVTLGGGSFLGIDIPRKTIGGGTLGGQTFSTPNIAQIPILDSGAVVTGPTIAGLAMNNRPEAVVPLDRAGGLGLTVNVYMDGATILEADDAEQYIVDMVDRAVRRGVVLGST